MISPYLFFCCSFSALFRLYPPYCSLLFGSNCICCFVVSHPSSLSFFYMLLFRTSVIMLLVSASAIGYFLSLRFRLLCHSPSTLFVISLSLYSHMTFSLYFIFSFSLTFVMSFSLYFVCYIILALFSYDILPLHCYVSLPLFSLLYLLYSTVSFSFCTCIFVFFLRMDIHLTLSLSVFMH